MIFAASNNEPHIIVMFQAPVHPNEHAPVGPISCHHTMQDALGPFPSEAAALAFLDEHELNRPGGFLWVITPLASPVAFAGAVGR